MLVKMGVDYSWLRPPIRRRLKLIDTIYKKHGSEAVITSTNEGDHMPSSLHYVNLAIDFRLPPPIDVASVLSALQTHLGDDYDVVLSSNHIHIEYDPR